MDEIPKGWTRSLREPARDRKVGIARRCRIDFMMDSRAQTLLKTLVERYIVDGQPGGSRVLSKQPGLELSPATIRNVMADLEELGYIASLRAGRRRCTARQAS